MFSFLIWRFISISIQAPHKIVQFPDCPLCRSPSVDWAASTVLSLDVSFKGCTAAHFTFHNLHWPFQSIIMWSQKYERPPRFQMVMVCYGVMDPPDPPYILILMASLQGIAFNMLWVGADYHHNDQLFRLNLSRARALRSEICSCLILAAQPSGIAYMTSVAPQALTGTAISLMATVTWVVGKGVKSCW